MKKKIEDMNRKDLFNELAEKGMTKEILSTHDDALFDIADRLKALEKGEAKAVINSINAGTENKTVSDFKLKQFIGSGARAYSDFTKGLPFDGNAALFEAQLNTTVLEQAIVNNAALSAIGSRSTENLDYRRTVLTVRPSVSLTAENVNFVPVDETDAQEYATIAGTFTKAFAFPKLTNEAIDQSDVSVQTDLLKLLAEQFEITMQDQVLHGDGGGTGTKADPKQLRGITNACIDRAAGYVEALKPAATRQRDVFAAVASGAASDIGTDAATLEANLYKLMLTVPERSQAMSSFMMHQDTLSFLMQTLKGSDGHSLIKINSIQENGVWIRRLSLFGAPIILNETMDIIEADAAPVVYGDFKAGYELLQPMNGSTHFIQDPYTIPDTVGFYMDSIFGSTVADHEALAVLVVQA